MSLVQITSGSFTASTTATATFSKPVNEGASIVVIIGQSGTAGPTINSMTDVQGNSYLNNGSNGSGTLSLNYNTAKNVKGGSITVTAVFSLAQTGIIVIAEHLGLDPKLTGLNIADPTGINGNYANNGSTTAVTTGSKTTLQANDMQIYAAINASSATYTAGAGWGNINNFTNGVITVGYEDKPSGAPGARTFTMTQSGAFAWVSQGFAFITTLNALNNYQFFKVGDGMSTGEKIR